MCVCMYLCIYIYIYMYRHGGKIQVRSRGQGQGSTFRSDDTCIFTYTQEGGASHERICDSGVVGMWYSRVPPKPP